ncbi:MAG: peptidoglycan-binding domain-containing protein [Minisyncoccia bacterium]
MRKILLSALFIISPSVTFGAGWCTTTACYVSRTSALAPSCISSCNETQGATIQLGTEEFALSCTTYGNSREYCPGYVAPTTAAQTTNTTSESNNLSGNTYRITTTAGGTTTTSEVTIQEPARETTSSGLGEYDALVLRIASEAVPTPSTRGYITEVPFDRLFTASGTASTATNTSTKSATASCATPFAKNLKQGDENDDVLAVQKFLNKETDTSISATGVGSSGAETKFFGSRMFDAVKRFQRKYASEILSAVNLDAPSGYWGPSTRAKANALACTR